MEKYKTKFIEKVLKHELFTTLWGSGTHNVALFIACQFALESDFGCSRLARECNNISGMRSPSLRLTLDVYHASGEFAVFYSWSECISDYFLWLAWNHFNLDDFQDLNKFKRKLVSCGYCPENDYINRINKIYLQFV